MNLLMCYSGNNQGKSSSVPLIPNDLHTAVSLERTQINIFPTFNRQPSVASIHATMNDFIVTVLNKSLKTTTTIFMSIIQKNLHDLETCLKVPRHCMNIFIYELNE